MYHQDSLQFPWFMTLGNHDIIGDVEFETVLAHKLDERWILPGPYYKHTLTHGNTKVNFIHYDSDCFISKYQQVRREFESI
jgi:hypothetical protein